MTGAHIALLAVGVIGLTESMWGITSPEKLKQAVERVAAEAPDRNVILGLFFLGLAGLFLVLMTSDQRPSDWALLVLSWILAGGAFVNFRNHGFHDLVGFLILNRSTTGIRLIYLGEFVFAAALLTIALMGY